MIYGEDNLQVKNQYIFHPGDLFVTETIISQEIKYREEKRSVESTWYMNNVLCGYTIYQYNEDNVVIQMIVGDEEEYWINNDKTSTHYTGRYSETDLEEIFP